MLSRLIPNIDFTDHKYTSSVSKKQLTPAPGESIKLHIGELMTKIPFGEANTKTIGVKGPTLFVNAPECKPVTKTTLKTQNYLSVIAGKTTNWDGIDTVTKAGGRIIKREVPFGMKIDCNFLAGILTHGMIETTRDLTHYNSTARNTHNIYSGDIGHILVYNPEEIGILSEHVDDLICKLQTTGVMGEN